MGNAVVSTKPKMVIISPKFKEKVNIELEIPKKVISCAYIQMINHMKEKYNIDHISCTDISEYEKSSVKKSERTNSKFRKEITNKFKEEQRNDIWIIELFINDSEKYDCEIFYPHLNDNMKILSHSLSLELMLFNVNVKVYESAVHHDIIIEANEYQYQKILRITFSKYLSIDRIRFIMKMLCDGIKKYDENKILPEKEYKTF